MFLYIGTFIFALANGTLEAVANPLVSTLFPNNRTHYLNILHASWPAGLVIGGLVGWILGDGMGVSWKMQLGLFLVPTVLYGIAFFGQHFPKSEASAKGPERRPDAARKWASWGARRLLPGGALLPAINWAASSVSSRAVRSSASPAWSCISWAVALVLVLIVGSEDELRHRIGSPVRPVYNSRPRRRGGTRHRRLDSKHHGQHPDAGSGQDPLRLHFAAHVLAALLRRISSRRA